VAVKNSGGVLELNTLTLTESLTQGVILIILQ